MEPQLGFDWSSLIGTGANIASNINAALTGASSAPTYGVTGATGGGLTSSPYFWPLVIGGVLVFFIMRSK